MSRIGKRPIKIEEGVVLELTGRKANIKCGNNSQVLAIPEGITVKQVDDTIVVTRKDDSKEQRSFHGLTTRLLRNIITGVKDGFTRELEFTGTGYRVTVQEKELVLNMGYSHEIKIEIPEDLTVAVKKNVIAISGADKQRVGQLAAKVREVRPPEVYKGKGIKYKEELIRRKAGKKAAS